MGAGGDSSLDLQQRSRQMEQVPSVCRTTPCRARSHKPRLHVGPMCVLISFFSSFFFPVCSGFDFLLISLLLLLLNLFLGASTTLWPCSLATKHALEWYTQPFAALGLLLRCSVNLREADRIFWSPWGFPDGSPLFPTFPMFLAVLTNTATLHLPEHLTLLTCHGGGGGGAHRTLSNPCFRGNHVISTSSWHTFFEFAFPSFSPSTRFE